MMLALRACLVSLCLAGVAALTGCSTNTTTGRSQLILMSWQEEASLGAKSKPELVTEFGGEVARPELRAYVNEVGQKLAREAVRIDPEMASLQWEFTLLNSDVINAFALPGGKVFMSHGLAKLMTSEAQLAGVLGHEVGHVAARHTNERFSKAAVAQGALGIGGAFLGDGAGASAANAIAGQVTELTLMKYGRDQELESDSLGMRYMAAAGYNPRAQREVMQILLNASKDAPPEFFSTHPHPENRIKRIDEMLATTYAETQNNPAYRTGEKEFRERYLNKMGSVTPGK